MLKKFQKTKPKKFPGTDKPKNLGTMVTQKETQQQTSSINPASVVKIAEPEAKEILPKKSPEEQYKFATSLIKVGDYDQAELALKEFVKKIQNKACRECSILVCRNFYIRQLYHDAAAAYLDGYQNTLRVLKVLKTFLSWVSLYQNLVKKIKAVKC